MDLNDISGDIIDAAMAIHRKLGPGLLESVYELVLVAELKRRGHKVENQVPVSFEYEGMKIENAFRIDVLVDDQVVVELKSTEAYAPVHAKQLKTYLVLSNRKLGLLLNFGMEYLKSGIKRILNGEVPDIKTSPGATEERRLCAPVIPNPQSLRVSVTPCEN